MEEVQGHSTLYNSETANYFTAAGLSIRSYRTINYLPLENYLKSNLVGEEFL
jgi:hypothetical protein